MSKMNQDQLTTIAMLEASEFLPWSPFENKILSDFAAEFDKMSDGQFPKMKCQGFRAILESVTFVRISVFVDDVVDMKATLPYPHSLMKGAESANLEKDSIKSILGNLVIALGREMKRRQG